MTHTLNVIASVGTDHIVQIRLPDAVPEGEVELFVVAVPKDHQIKSTLGDLLSSEIIGMWSDRTDIEDSATYARQLRESAWKRSGDDPA